MPTTLTDRLIKSIEPPAKGKRIYWDDHRESPKGFGLRVLASGTKALCSGIAPSPASSVSRPSASTQRPGA
jgi:hypothetical protein